MHIHSAFIIARNFSRLSLLILTVAAADAHAIRSTECTQFGGTVTCVPPLDTPDDDAWVYDPLVRDIPTASNPEAWLAVSLPLNKEFYSTSTLYKNDFCDMEYRNLQCADPRYSKPYAKPAIMTRNCTYEQWSKWKDRFAGCQGGSFRFDWPLRSIYGQTKLISKCQEDYIQTEGVAFLPKTGRDYPFLCAIAPLATPGDDAGDPTSPDVTPPAPEAEPPPPPSPEPATPEVGDGGSGGSGEGDECSGVVGDPINTATGSKFVVTTDYAPASNSLIRLVRYYDNRMAAPGAFGSHWRHEYDRKVEVVSATEIKLRRADGKGLAYSLANGKWVSDDGSALRLETREAAQGWRVRTPIDELEIYDTQGRLLQIVAKGGMTLTTQYDQLGRLQNVTDNFGRQLAFEYKNNGLITAAVDPAGKRYQYTYDLKGNLNLRTTPDNRILQYLYQNPALPNALTAVIDGNGVQIDTTFYDQKGRAYSNERTGGIDKVDIGYQEAGRATVTGLGATSYTFQLIQGVMKVTGMTRSCPSCGAAARSFDRDERGNVISRTDYNGVRTTYQYDPVRNLEISRTEAAATAAERTIVTEWHPTLNVPARITEPGRIIDMAYDEIGNMTALAVTDTESSERRTWSYEYGEHGLLASRTLPSGEKTSYAYSSGWLSSTTTASGLVTQYLDYDPSGRLGRIIHPSGHTVAFTYDDVGRVLTRSESVQHGAEGQNWWQQVIEWLSKLLGLDTVNPQAQGDSGMAVTRYGYDNAGLLTDVTLPDGEALHYEYDAAYRLILARDALGNTVRIIRDPYGNPVDTQVNDEAGSLALSLQRTYDELGRLAKVLGNNGQELSYRYDQEGYLLERTNALGQRSARGRDAAYRTTLVTDADSQSTGFEFDPLDQLTAVTDARGNETRFIRNAFGEATGERSPDRGNSLHEFENGRLKRTTDARGIAHEYTYDADGRVLSSASPNGRVVFHHDQGEFGKGRLAGFDDASGTTRYSYNSRGQVTEKTSIIYKGTTLKISYGYTLGGKLKEVATPGKHLVQYGYDANGRISHISVDGQPLLGGVRFGALGIVGWTWSNGEVRAEQYDLDGRVVRINSGNALSRVYGYDTANRITTLVDDYAGLNDRYSYDAAGRLISQQGGSISVSYDYDALGNRTRKRVTDGNKALATTYGYDSFSNHLLSETQTGRSKTYSYLSSGQLSGDGTAVYSYNDEGRLIEVTGQRPLRNDYNALGQRIRKAGQGVLLFAYDESGRLIGEYTPGGVMVREYVWLGDRLVGMLNQQEKGVLFVHADHLGTPRAVSNGATVLWRWEGEAFGNTAPNEQLAGPSRKLTLPLRFPGQYADSETGTFYNYFRDYSPSIGRYVESDPIGLYAGPNTYAYVGGNPLSLIDSLGLEWVYSQSTGALGHADNQTGGGEAVGEGYAGHNQGLNNPASQHVPGGGSNSNAGPLPQGGYTIEPQQDNVTGSGTSLPGSMRLTPDAGNDMSGRAGFLIHGGNMTTRSSSQGCIVLPPNIRNRIGNSGDNRLRVVP